MSAKGITIIGASAGSGKTYRLTEEVIRAISSDAALRIDVAGLMAVTFTRKAHVELEARIRQKLVEEEAYDEALRLPFAYIGTVHAASLRLLQEFAIDAGLSPNVDVVAGNETKLLRQSFERSLDVEARARLDELAARLELRIDHRSHRMDWVTPVADVMDLARSNRIAPDDLPAMAERSVTKLLALLPRAVADGAILDADLSRSLNVAAEALTTANDGVKRTIEALEMICDARRRLADGELRWSDWVKLASLSPSKSCARHVVELHLAAARYEEHPRLHEELRDLTHAVFEAARAGLVAYQEWKRTHRVIDYIDMLDGALDLIEHPRVRAELSKRLGLVVVDEFQDTSPIQLALFMRLQSLVARSTWVGDRKQCIFEYAGADPALIDAVAAWVEETGGHRERLGENHRSRPELVRVCSELFAAAFARHDFTRDEVVVKAVRHAHQGLAGMPPLGVWMLDVANATDEAEAVAQGVFRLLDAPHVTPVLDRASQEIRPVRAGDIAICVATNSAAARVASALHARNVRVAIARAGLLDTPEGTLVDSALRWLLDPSDRLSAAVIDALTGWAGADPDAWLAEQLRDVTRMSELKDDRDGLEDPRGPGDHREATGWRAALLAVRPRLAVLSPIETLDATLAALDALHLCARWPDPLQRIGNLDALRGVALSYEARCAQEREAATVAGLLRYCDNLRAPELHRDEALPADDQHVSSDDGAVVVCTYHKSKGLEWPVVILTNLDRPERRDAFDVMPESDGDGFDPEHPLANRRIRYWPWPFGATRKAPLAMRAEQSAEGRDVARREDKERVRLLYVGFTRARDHLILAARAGKVGAKVTWLDSLRDSDGPLLSLPSSANDDTMDETLIRVPGGPLRVATRVLRLDAVRAPKNDDERSPIWFERPGEPTAPLPPYRIAPSKGAADWPELALRIRSARVRSVERLQSAITLQNRAYDDEVLGNCVHAFLAADLKGIPIGSRLERASSLIEGWQLSTVLSANSLVEAGDALRAWVTRRWPRAIWHREIPIEGTVTTEIGERRVSGIVDLLLETEAGWVVIDHKTFPARSESAWRAKCTEFIPQLLAYGVLLQAVEARLVPTYWVHLPIGGAMVEIVDQVG